LLMAVDSTYTDGPWDLGEHFRKINGVVKYSHGDIDGGFALEFMGYDGRWRSTDQIPLRAVAEGTIDRFGFIDPTDGGETHRYSVSGKWWGTLGAGKLRASLYGIDYRLDLFSNFTYDTDTEHGDHFEQFDKRHIFGADIGYEQSHTLLGKDSVLNAGVQIRRDDIAPVGLYKTQARQRFDTVRQDDVVQTSYSTYVSEQVTLTDWFRTEAGLRFDEFRFDVDSTLAANSGRAN